MSNNTEGGVPAFPVSEEAVIRNLMGLSAREYAAIKLRVPDSGTEWLDAMIRKSLRDELAAKAMQGMFVIEQFWDEPDHEHQARNSYLMADTMLKARDA